MLKLRSIIAVMALSFGPGLAQAQVSYTIDTAVTGTNGGNTLDGGDTITVTANGSVTTTAYGAMGLFQSGNGGALTNNGAISTSADAAFAIRQAGDNANLTNGGTITTSGRSSSGMFIHGNDGIILNSGSITTSGYAAYGIGTYGDRGNLTNEGTVTTSGTISHGMFLAYGQDGEIINNGTIITTGSSAHGMYIAELDGGTITNNGFISATGAGGFAINMQGTNGTINLNAGSVLIGDINFTNPASATLNFGPGLNAVVRTSGGIPASINVANGGYAVVGSTIYAVDSSGAGAKNLLTQTFAGQIGTALGNRHTGTQRMSRSGAAPGGGAWAQVIGQGYFETGAGAAMGGYGAALLAGYENPNGSGYFGGAMIGTSSGTGQWGTTTGALVGFYRQMNIAGKPMEFALNAGYMHNTTVREIADNTTPTGTTTASATFDSYFVNPAITLDGLAGVESLSLRLAYMGVYTPAYSETGSTANISYGDDFAHFLLARVENRSQLSERFSLDYGVDAGYAAAPSVTASIAGSPVSAISPGESAFARGFVAMNLNSANTTGLAYDATLEVGMSTSGVLDASLSLKACF